MVRRVVIKVGTSTLVTPDGALDAPMIRSLAQQVAQVYSQGVRVVVVSSGAVRTGRIALRQHPCADVSQEIDSQLMKHAAASLGQPILMKAYVDAFSANGIPVGQVLVTRSDFGERHRFLEARARLNALLQLRVVPIVNENDTIATSDVGFGDNDTLAALTASLLDADLLLVLSDVDGLYDRDPSEPGAVRFDVITEIGADAWQAAGGSRSGVGTGGMRTKLRAAQVAMTSGVRMVIAHGRHPAVVMRACGGEPVGTQFLPQQHPLRQRARWLAYGLPASGWIEVNEGARDALQANKSLLPAGVVSCGGEFGPHSIVEVRDAEGGVFARGYCNYSEPELRMIAGYQTRDIVKRLGYKRRDEVIHRDDLVLVSGSLWQEC